MTPATGNGFVGVLTYKQIGASCASGSAGSGNTYVGVGVYYSGGPDGLFYSVIDWAAHDQDGRQYETEYAGYCYSEGGLDSGQLGPRLTTSGIVLFEIPVETQHLYVDWRDTFSGARETWRLW